MRLDQYLVEKKLVKSRSKAKELIQSSLVFVDSICVTKPSFQVLGEVQIEIKNAEILQYVSRGALKLKPAIARAKISVSGKKCLDVGVSTGGFSQCLLELDASSVVGVDVGQAQTDSDLLDDQRFRVFEKINAKQLEDYPELSPYLEDIDLVVMDVSFISITKILPSLVKNTKKNTELLSLVKPQFELDKKSLNKQGIVKSEDSYLRVEEKIKDCLKDLGCEVLSYFPSSIEGGDGNKEFFVHVKFS